MFQFPQKRFLSDTLLSFTHRFMSSPLSSFMTCHSEDDVGSAGAFVHLSQTPVFFPLATIHKGSELFCTHGNLLMEPYNVGPTLMDFVA